MGELTIAGTAMTPADIAVQEWRQRIEERMVKGQGKTGMLAESETASAVKDELVEQQAETIHELQENLKFWLEQAGLLTAANEILQTRYDEATKIAVQYAQAIGEYQAKNDRYRMALLAVVGAGSYEEAERVAREALGPV